MKKIFIVLAVLAVGAAVAVPSLLPHTAVTAQSIADPSPALTNTCLITSDVNRLSAFYAKVLKTKSEKTGNDYVEFRTGSGVLAIFSAEAQEKYIPGSAKPGE